MCIRDSAKTAGGTLKLEIPSFLRTCANSSARFHTAEECLGGLARDDGRRVLTMLRAPRSHVISQFMMLRYRNGWCKGNGTAACCDFPGGDDEAALGAWLAHYARAEWSPAEHGDFRGGCYTPWNMQARALTCARGGGTSHAARSAAEARPAAADAARAAAALGWVGLTELYAELSLIHISEPTRPY